jgi:hypothetical protein
MTLKYPMEAGGVDSDYVTFTPLKYRTNADQRKGGAGAAAPTESGAQSVILYMPNSTPGMGNGNDWGKAEFAGPVGELQKGAAGALGATLAGAIGGSGISDITQSFASRAKSTLKDANFAGAGAQMVARKLSNHVSASPNQMLALGTGKVFNPNVELLYSAPSMRSFSMAFDMIPKNETEARRINEIIMNFKKWSSPSDLENGMFEIPHVWQVTYMSGSSENKNMNRFKKAACTNVQVQANSSTSMHVAHEGGVPIITSLTLNFMEVDIITREDHNDVGGQGY